jgi:hypothetical protein
MRAMIVLLISLLGWGPAAMADAKAGKKAEKKVEKIASNPSLENYFRALDLNGDGFVSLAEAAGDPVIVQRFDKADRNRDGKLSEKEFANLSKVKLRVAKARKDKGKEEEPSAAVGGTRPASLTRAERRRQRQIEQAAEGGG